MAISRVERGAISQLERQHLQEPMVLRALLDHVPPAQHRHRGELLLLLLRVRPELEVADGDRDDVGQVGEPAAGLELASIGLARVIHDAVDEARVMDELHFDHERHARMVLAPDVQDRQLRPLRQGELLARQVLERDDGLRVAPVEQVVQEAAEDVRVRREDAPEDEVVLQVREGHASGCPRGGQDASVRAPPHRLSARARSRRGASPGST
jgi:hypothetical protein